MPAAFKTVVASVVQYYESIFTNPITLNIDVGYGEIDGEKLGSGDLGESEDTDQSFSYAQIRNALVANATSASQLQAVSTLPTTSPVSGSFSISLAEATALGLISGGTTLDGYVGFSSTTSFAYNDSNGVPAGEYDLYGDVAHEISEVMGRISDVDTGTTSVMDLYRYSASGVRALSNHQSTAYFSINGGATDLANFNTNPEGDYGDWASSVGNDAYLAFSNSGVVNPVSQTDLTVMNVLGYDLAIAGSAPTVTAIAEQPSTGELAAGKTVIVTLDFSEAVTVSGTPTLTLNDKGTATYTGGTGSSALAFSYTVAASDASVASLAATTVNLNGGAIQDSLGNNATLSLTGLTQTGPQIDPAPPALPAVVAVVEQPSTGTVSAGATIKITLDLNETVTVTCRDADTDAQRRRDGELQQRLRQRRAGVRRHRRRERCQRGSAGGGGGQPQRRDHRRRQRQQCQPVVGRLRPDRAAGRHRREFRPAALWDGAAASAQRERDQRLDRRARSELAHTQSSRCGLRRLGGNPGLRPAGGPALSGVFRARAGSGRPERLGERVARRCPAHGHRHRFRVIARISTGLSHWFVTDQLRHRAL